MVTIITGGGLTGTVDIDNPLLHPDPPHAISQGLPASGTPSFDGVSGECTPSEDHPSYSESDSDSDTESSSDLELLHDLISRDVSGRIYTQDLVERLQDFHLCIPEGFKLSAYDLHWLFTEKATQARQSLAEDIDIIMLDHPDVDEPSHVSFYKFQLNAIRRALLILDTFEKVLESQEQNHRRRESCHRDLDRHLTVDTQLEGPLDTKLLIGDPSISRIAQSAFDVIDSIIGAQLIGRNSERNPTRNGPTLAHPVLAPESFSDASGLDQSPAHNPQQFSSVDALNGDPPSYYEATNPISVTNTVIRNVGNLPDGSYSAFVGSTNSTNCDRNFTASGPTSNALPWLPFRYSAGFNSGNVSNTVIENVGNTTMVSITDNDGVQHTLSSTSRGRIYHRSGY